MNDHFDTLVRVRYAETDQMGVVYHANYFLYFEIGRTEYIRSIGVEYKKMETEDDCFFVVASAKIRHLRPARYDDLLRIRTRITEANRRTARISYEVFNDASGELLTRGETYHVFCDHLGRPKLLPEKYRRYFEPEARPASAPAESK
ncbi:MAG TPA: thioesterase family protein [Methylomirabilota bacterium]|jgi:acyl-CoA thioester hydrolase|nr:thioesterase family protein [Methylomirabilota bacterium]